jgi:hypothetical protein
MTKNTNTAKTIMTAEQVLRLDLLRLKAKANAHKVRAKGVR